MISILYVLAGWKLFDLAMGVIDYIIETEMDDSPMILHPDESRGDEGSPTVRTAEVVRRPR